MYDNFGNLPMYLGRIERKFVLTLTAENWRKIAKDFEVLWDYPNCIGALDGKHIDIVAPSNSGSSYYNYKGKHSINLMAISDSKYFSIVDIGAEGRQSDGGVFGRSEIGIDFQNNNMDLLEPTEMEVNGQKLSYVLVADEAFVLRPYIMRPFPRSKRLDIRKKVFNYRLSRASSRKQLWIACGSVENLPETN